MRDAALLLDGCITHGLTAEDVAAWWRVAEDRDVGIGFCACCCGPAPAGLLTCLKCSDLTAEQRETFTKAPPCTSCAKPGYTFDVDRGWRCEECWRGDGR